MTSHSSLQFVVLHHTDVDHPHFDLIFETSPGSELFGVRLSEWPITANTTQQTSSPHRRHYLTFEGDIPGQRGRVRRVAMGTCEVEGVATSLTVKLDTGDVLDVIQQC